VRRGEKVTVDVQVQVTGEAAPETFVTEESQVLQLEVAATAIPEKVEVSVEGLEPGSQIHASDIELPAGASLVTEGDHLVVNVTAQVSAEALEAELADAEAEAGIEHEEPDTAADQETEAAQAGATEQE
jgi:large subunit ribosomal protein L25